jgi:type II secretory pathway component PulK
MSRRGFALITVLWVITALSLTVGDVLLLARTGLQVSANRTQLRRAAWAREACEAIVRARFAADSLTRTVARVDLGRDVWCTATLTDLGTVLRVPMAHVGLESDTASSTSADSASDITRTGLRVNVNAASDTVLAARLGLDLVAARALVTQRQAAGPYRVVEVTVNALPPLTARRIMTNYSRFASAITLGPEQFVAQIDGGVGAHAPTAHALLRMVPAGGRLVVTQRDEW